MPWNAHKFPEHPIIEISVHHVLAANEIRDAVLAVRTLAHNHRATTLLVDLSALDAGQSVIDLLFLTDAFETADKLGDFEKTVLLPPHLADATRIEFWKTACATRKTPRPPLRRPPTRTRLAPQIAADAFEAWIDCRNRK